MQTVEFNVRTHLSFDMKMTKIMKFCIFDGLSMKEEQKDKYPDRP
jgi:hypothetical protein